MIETKTLEDIYEQLLRNGEAELFDGKQNLIYCKNLRLLSDKGYRMVNFISRHKTTKDMYEFTIEKENDKTFQTIVVMTEDHSCMLWEDGMFEDVEAKYATVGQYVKLYDEKHDTQCIGVIRQIKNLGKTDEMVYDVSLGDYDHVFYANGVLVHNSQFVNLECLSSYIRNKYNLSDNIQEWEQKYRDELWETMRDIVDNDINKFVRSMVHQICHTTKQDVLTYELEYMADIAIYESKKHYAIHKIFDEGDAVNKIKYSGIELKKASLPVEIKGILRNVYEGLLLYGWGEEEFAKYINESYEKFKKMSIDEISIWVGYSTERQASGFLEMEKGTTGVAKACTYYNQLLKTLKLDKKYDEIRIGDKIRLCRIVANNRFGINVIAYKNGFYPKEFNKIFEPDYAEMFSKVVLKPLKQFRSACGFSEINPSQAPMFDISLL